MVIKNFVKKVVSENKEKKRVNTSNKEGKRNPPGNCVNRKRMRKNVRAPEMKKRIL